MTPAVLCTAFVLNVLASAQLWAQPSVVWRVRGDTTGAPAGCSAAAGIAAIDTFFTAMHDVDSARLDRAMAFRFVFSTGKFTPSDTFVRASSMSELLRYARTRAIRHERMTLQAVRFYPWRGARMGFLPYFVRDADDLGEKKLAGIGKAEYWCAHGIRVLNLAPRPAYVLGPQDADDDILGDLTLAAFFKDTGRTAVLGSEGRGFDLRRPSQRDSLRAVLKRERDRWRAIRPSHYGFVLRVSCFCPGPRGWLLMVVQRGQPLRAWDRTGKAAALIDWNTFSIDGLFDNLERSIDRNGSIELTFDPRWHFPTYVRTVALPGPDAWGIIEARGFARLMPSP